MPTIKIKKENKLLSLSQASSMLSVSDQTLRNMVDRGEINAYVSDSGQRRFQEYDVRGFIAKRNNSLYSFCVGLVWNGEDFFFEHCNDDFSTTLIPVLTTKDIQEGLKILHASTSEESCLSNDVNMIRDYDYYHNNQYGQLAKNNPTVKLLMKLLQSDKKTVYKFCKPQAMPYTDDAHLLISVLFVGYDKETFLTKEFLSEATEIIAQKMEEIPEEFVPNRGIYSYQQLSNNKWITPEDPM